MFGFYAKRLKRFAFTGFPPSSGLFEFHGEFTSTQQERQKHAVRTPSVAKLLLWQTKFEFESATKTPPL